MLPKSVLIAGAGPAGLQAAIAAARNGHRVTVCEQSAQAGGQVRLAASVPNRAELGDMIRNQLTECRRLGVTIEYGIGVGSGLVAERRPDHVIVATGAEPQRPWWVPEDATTVADIRDVLEGRGATVRRRDGDRRDRLPSRDVGRRVAGRSRLRGRDRHARDGRRPGPRRHARHGELVDPRHRARASCSAPTWCRWEWTGDRSRCSTIRRANRPRARRTGSCSPCRNARSSGCTTSSSNDGVSVERVGDCVAPRRAHAAVVEGDRAGASV